jgi:hypothetical protein
VLNFDQPSSKRIISAYLADRQHTTLPREGLSNHRHSQAQTSAVNYCMTLTQLSKAFEELNEELAPPPLLHDTDSLGSQSHRSSPISRTGTISVQSISESVNDFLDLYANSEDSEDEYRDDENSQLERDSPIETGSCDSLENVAMKNTERDKISSNYKAEPAHYDVQNIVGHTIASTANETNDSKLALSDNIIEKAPQTDTFNEIVSSQHPSHLGIADEHVSEETTILDPTTTANDTLQIPTLHEDSGMQQIDASVLHMIENLGSSMGPNDEIEIELFSDHVNSNDFGEVLKRHSVNLKVIDDMDFLSVDMSSIDEDYDDNERFRDFYGIDRAFSSESLQRNQQDDLATHTEPAEVVVASECGGPEEVGTSNSYLKIDRDVPNLVPFDSIDESIADTTATVQQLSIADIVEEEEESSCDAGPAPVFCAVEEGTSSDFPPTDPPPYSEIDQLLSTDAQSEPKTLVLPTTPQKSVRSAETPTTPSSTSSTSSSANPRRRLSIKVKKNQNGEISRHASIDYYHLDRYLPPYRSLINPKKAYDYRTKTYINTADNDIEIRSGEDDRPIVAIHKRKRDSKLVSMLLNTNNNIKQKILDVTSGDNSSIRSRAVSIKSLTHSLHSSEHKEQKYKATAQFKDLPKDVHQLIIKHLDNQKDWVNCLYVSHTFHLHTLPHLYKYPRFTSTYRLGQFVHLIMNRPKLAALVKVLDLSHITAPVTLTKEEMKKYHGRIEYGTTAAMEVLNDRTKIVYAGWRDWKYRSHPLYGDFGNWRRRGSSISTLSSGNSSLNVTWEKNQSAPNLLESKKVKHKGAGSSNRSRSNSASENLAKRAVKGARQRSQSTSNSANCAGSASSNGFKSLKKAFGLEPTVLSTPVVRKKKDTSPVRKQLTKAKSATITTSTKNSIVKNKSKGSPKVNHNVSFTDKDIDPQRIPFGTPHPRISAMLKPYCFHRDIPAGYIIHILKECGNLEEINLSGIVICNEYELLDYETFDWSTGNGRTIQGARSPVVLDEMRPIFWSDTGRDMDMDEDAILKGYAKGVSFKNVWEALMGLEHIKKLQLQKINSIEQSIIERFITSSGFKDTLKFLDCSNSGMVKREEWNHIFKAYEWKDYFASESV